MLSKVRNSLYSRIDPYLLLLLGLSLLVLAPLLAPGYFYSTHDGRHSVFYLTMFDEAIRDGALWPRWAMHHNQGYGYPTFVVQAPLSFYVAEIFVLLGAGHTQAVKLAWMLGFFASGWGMYALVKYWLLSLDPAHGEEDSSPDKVQLASLAGLVAGLLYVYSPYHLLDIYVRGAYAEFMLMAWFPWVFLAFDRLLGQGTRPGWQTRTVVATLLLAGLLLTHVLSLLAFTPLLIGFVLFRLGMGWWPDRRSHPTFQHATRLPARLIRRAALAATAGVSALLLAAIFLLPLLVEGPLLDQKVYTENTYSYQRHWVFFGQFFNPFWGFGYSDDPTGVNDGMGFQLGVLVLLLAVVALYLIWRRPPNRRPVPGSRALFLFLLLASAAVLFTTTPAAAFIWAAVPMIEVIQFPWRLLTLSSFTLCALGGLVVGRLLIEPGRWRGRQLAAAGALVVALLAVYAGFNFVRVPALLPVEPWREDGRAVFQFEQDHPDMIGYTQWVEEPFTESAMTAQYLDADFSPDKLERLGILAGQGRVLSHYSRGESFGGVVAMETPSVVQIRVYYFPGWRVTVDGDPVDVRVSGPDGLMEVDVPAGRHRIDARLGTTPVRTAGVALSGATLLALAGLWLWGRRNHSGKKKPAG